MANVRFAVVGFKHFHILEFVKGMGELPDSELVGIYDSDAELREKYSSELGAPAYDSIEDLVAKAQPEVVGLAEVNAQKADAIRRLTELGCHVLADKPLVTSLEQLDAVEAAAAKTGKQIGLMLLERYHGPTRRVYEELESGRLGKLVNFTALAPHKLKPDDRPAWMFEPDLYGGVLNDLAIHNLDLCRWIAGREPSAVTAVEGCLRFDGYRGFTDHAEIFVEFADSSTAMVRADWLTPEAFPSHGDGRQFYECTEGTIEVVAVPDIHTLGQGQIKFAPWDRDAETLEPSPPSRSLYEEFVALCRGEQQADLLPSDGFRSTRLTLYARKAARTHQRIELQGKL